ncbi:hypothetical protein KSP39_PZI016407 [Platanthera zijinensis]|uniref:Reverse transcriptase zinc-binding domain-containing protein n=1 Tax=Platanthera zijinensis TaxID=2320716 RepID=A0AAP0B787_9ASPA
MLILASYFFEHALHIILFMYMRILMANVAARVVRADGSLFAHTFGGKYTGRDRFQPNRHQSKIWKCISLGSELVERQTLWMVGDGAAISTMDDTWVGALPLKIWPTFIDIDAMPNVVANLLDPNYNWMTEKLVSFGKILIEVILGLKRDNIGGPDRLIWAHSEKSAMDAYVIYNLESPQSTLIGQEIWKIKSQPQFLMMICRAMNDMLPTNDWLYQHRLRLNAACPWRCNQAENTVHVFGSCSFMAWIRSELERMNFHINPNCNSLLDALLDEMPIRMRSTKIKLLSSIICNTCKARNQRAHGEPFPPPSSIVLNAILDASDGNWATHLNLDSSWLSRH